MSDAAVSGTTRFTRGPAAFERRRAPEAPALPVGRARHAANLGSVAVGAVGLLVIALGLWGPWHNATAVDFFEYRGAAASWLQSGSFYLPFQLTDRPYDLALTPVLYPPTLLWLLVPFAAVPPLLPLWWVLPIGITAGVIAWHRPASWTWPFIAFVLIWPRTAQMVWFGNPGMWIVAGVALATVWPACSVSVFLKPSLAPFALVGMRRRSWWIALAVFCAASAPFAGLWLQYPGVVARAGIGLGYSLLEAPVVALPLVAALGHRGRRLRFPFAVGSYRSSPRSAVRASVPASAPA